MVPDHPRNRRSRLLARGTMKQPKLRLQWPARDPIGKKSVSEMVVQSILDLVKAGHISAGDKLPVRA
jgi:hypothetical protein